ncbi:MAG: hypothetical protein JST90_18790 [Bacteroidetes bacterium]|nr:hypothetical protein [Bacteroidota bacterium]
MNHRLIAICIFAIMLYACDSSNKSENTSQKTEYIPDYLNGENITNKLNQSQIEFSPPKVFNRYFGHEDLTALQISSISKHPLSIQVDYDQHSKKLYLITINYESDNTEDLRTKILGLIGIIDENAQNFFSATLSSDYFAMLDSKSNDTGVYRDENRKLDFVMTKSTNEYSRDGVKSLFLEITPVEHPTIK